MGQSLQASSNQSVQILTARPVASGTGRPNTEYHEQECCQKQKGRRSDRLTGLQGRATAFESVRRCSCPLSFLGASPQIKYCPLPSHLHTTTNPPLCSEFPDLLRPQILPDNWRHHCPCASCTSDPQERRPSIMAQKCVHQGCGKMYTDQDEVCRYHPGPPIFHEGQKGKSYVTNPSATFHFRPPQAQRSS